jgi:hypothetical protein
MHERFREANDRPEGGKRARTVGQAEFLDSLGHHWYCAARSGGRSSVQAAPRALASTWTGAPSREQLVLNSYCQRMGP